MNSKQDATFCHMDPELVAIVHRMDRRFKHAGLEDLSSLGGAIDKRGKASSTASRAEMPGFSVLAHEWGDLKEKSPLKVIDKELQKFVQFSLEALEEGLREGEDLTWAKVVETFNQNIYMEPDDSKSIERTKKFQAQVGNKVNLGRKGRGEKDQEIVKNLETWLSHELVVDPNIIKTTKLPVDRVNNIVARTGPICYKHIRLPNARHGLDFVDVGIIRYPSFHNPYIQVYRIHLEAWTSCRSKWGLVQETTSGVEGRLSVRTYKPRSEVIRETLKSAQENELRRIKLKGIQGQ